MKCLYNFLIFAAFASCTYGCSRSKSIGDEVRRMQERTVRLDMQGMECCSNDTSLLHASPALAERAYRKAYAVMPNRLYPLYKLMLLYHETGLQMKERGMAEKILRMKPKVESSVTKEMQEQARKTLLERI